jgi:hypothetical protein
VCKTLLIIYNIVDINKPTDDNKKVNIFVCAFVINIFIQMSSRIKSESI